uniref:SAM domain-containing protein n=1 Tax=Rhizophora mucronata TaxID=61149 RepID=A0A2P2QML8_RHIMU
MYADRVETGAKRSIKDRLNGNSSADAASSRPTLLFAGKRQRQDDKWEHDLFEDDEPHVSKHHKYATQDLRLKLQKKSSQQASQSVKGSVSVVRDLREKLSGTMNVQPGNADPPKTKLETSKPLRKNVALEASDSVIKKFAGVASRKKSQQKADASVDSFLQSLGLEKYIITFQAEEVDMTALVHMTDEDLKAMGIPMGPRKKILLELESRS